MARAITQAAIGVFCLLLSVKAAYGGQATSPSDSSSNAVTVPGLAEGNVNSTIPFGLGSPYAAPNITGRYQQVYAASAFNRTVMNITGIAFRNDQNNAPTAGSSQLGNVLVMLSVTDKPVGGLDTTFANNLSATATTVYSGPLTFSWSASGGALRPFELIIPLQKAFSYNPSLGNLLMDITTIAGNVRSGTDALDASSDSGVMSCVFHESALPTGWQDVAGTRCSAGLVTQFRTGAVILATNLPSVIPGTVSSPIRMGEGVTPPSIISRVEPQYSEEARKAGYQGTVILEVVVRKDGTVQIRRVAKSLGFGLDENAIAAVSQWRFRPGIVNGQAVDVVVNIEVSFQNAANPAAEPPRVQPALPPGVSPPTVVSRVEPDYTEAARAARYQGTVVLEVMVRKDGTPDVVRVVRPLGLGLDEQAADAIRKWRFKPGMRDGQPVDVKLNIEVNFNMK